MLAHSTTFGDLLYVGLPLVGAACVYILFIVGSLSIVRSSASRIEELVELGALGSSSALRILERSDAYLLCTQTGRLCSSLAAGFCLAFFTGDITRLFGPHVTEGHSAYGVGVAALVTTLFVGGTLICVQIAKGFALQFPEKALCLVALPLTLSCSLLGPILLFVDSMVSKVLTKLRIRVATERDIAVTTDDLSEIVKFSTEAGSLEQSEQRLIEGVVDFSERIVREVMTPRKDIVWAKEATTTEELIAIFTKEAVSRVLICGADLDDVKGMILAKDLLQFVAKSVDPIAWRSLVRPTYVVPNTKPVDDLLFELRLKGIHLAVVLDEHGGVGGIVTLEDLVEEIVGEIFDETDVGADREPVVQQVDGRWLIDGRAPIDALPESFGIIPSEGHYDTVAGFILDKVGRLPEQGEIFTLEGLECTVLEVRRHHISRVSVRVLPRPDEVEESDQEPLTVNAASPARGKS